MAKRDFCQETMGSKERRGDSLKTRGSFRVGDKPTAGKDALLQTVGAGGQGNLARLLRLSRDVTLLRNTSENPPQS